jgi:hypothetical protein
MRDLSILEEQLLDEYMRCERNLDAQIAEINRLGKGYLSRKNIQGREYYYLQWKEDGKVKSKYVAESEVPELKHNIENRRRWEKSVSNLKRSMKQIEKALGKDLINEYKQSL